MIADDIKSILSNRILEDLLNNDSHKEGIEV